MGCPSWASGIPAEQFNQKRLDMVGRTHPLKAILKKRRKVIKLIFRDQHFSVKTCKNEKYGAFEGLWGTLRAIQPEPSG